MDIKNLENKFKIFKESIYFNYSLKKLNWFNIGGDTKIYFKPDTLQSLVEFLKIYKKEEKLFVLGAGSNVLFKDDLFDGAVIKLSKNFSRISLLNENTIIAGSGALDKTLSEFALENSLGGFDTNVANKFTHFVWKVFARKILPTGKLGLEGLTPSPTPPTVS